MISKRWGTHQASKEGSPLASKKNLERSLARREQSEVPEIFCSSRRFPTKFMVDPGDDLKRVLNFEKIITRRKILFRIFRQLETWDWHVNALLHM